MRGAPRARLLRRSARFTARTPAFPRSARGRRDRRRGIGRSSRATRSVRPLRRRLKTDSATAVRHPGERCCGRRRVAHGCPRRSPAGRPRQNRRSAWLCRSGTDERDRRMSRVPLRRPRPRGSARAALARRQARSITVPILLPLLVFTAQPRTSGRPSAALNSLRTSCRCARRAGSCPPGRVRLARLGADVVRLHTYLLKTGLEVRSATSIADGSERP